MSTDRYAARAPMTAPSAPCARREPNSSTARPCAARTMRFASYRLGLVENRVNVNQPGGMIQIDIKDDDTIYMTGTVGYVADMSVAESFFS